MKSGLYSLFGINTIYGTKTRLMRIFSLHIILIFLPIFFIYSENESEFFENRIRPVLAENCYECHNSLKMAKSGLILDFKDGILKGGERGPSISLSNPKAVYFCK